MPILRLVVRALPRRVALSTALADADNVIGHARDKPIEFQTETLPLFVVLTLTTGATSLGAGTPRRGFAYKMVEAVFARIW